MTQPRTAPPAWPLGAALERVDALLAQGQPALLVGLEASARAFALARSWLAAPRTWLVACPTLAAAEHLCRDLEFFLAGAAGGRSPVRLYPAYEVSPYEEVSPPAEITARRLAVLWELIAEETPLIVVTSARGLSARLCPPEHLLDCGLSLEPGQSLERQKLIDTLLAGGYSAVGLVEQVGDFAVRGSVVDFYGPLLEDPVRVEFFGDEVESLRSFDPVDQRSQLPLAEATLIPCHPADLSPAGARRAVAGLRKLAAAEGLSSRRLAELVEKVELRTTFAGQESLLPLYYDRAADLFEFLPENRLHVLVEPAEINARLIAEAETLDQEYAAAQETGRVALPPPRLRRTPAQVDQRLGERPRFLSKALALGELAEPGVEMIGLKAGGHPGLHADLARKGEGSLLERFVAWVRGQGEDGRDVLLVCRSRAQLERLGEILTERELSVASVSAPAQAAADLSGQGRLWLCLGSLGAGFAPAELPITFVTEDEVFGAPRVVRQKAPPKLSALLAALDDLAPGDLVVHVDHGVGRYEGLLSMAVGPAESDFLLLTYHGGDKLYLPADRIGLISKYRGPEGAAPALERLGGKAWQKTRSRVKKAVEAIARDLVELYAARSFQKGFAFAQPDSAFREFEAAFRYQETPDQARAIEEVIGDLTAPRPMDRLICGDVGFGKTEVALRAAFLVAMQGRQVAFLVPTTVLAEQHYQTFFERLTNEPLIVESLSRFKTAAQQKAVLSDLAKGKIDIIVGTHRLLSGDVIFKDLGLVVVDEEQRFGVQDKEKLKKLRRLVDVLTLTATPIPRTLQMSLSGIRDLSVINTPPADRQAIRTYLATFSAASLREAVQRELDRGGQVFCVHNRVQDIARIGRLVKDLAPQARVGVAHGQLAEKSLEKVMMAFVRRELDVLVCTTIIESGLDIPSANTIIINDADKLGLGQIYQLRGRVGRGGEKAYAYLFVKSETSLSRDAAKRLKALMDFTQLGSGFAIAMHDLQIRGAGNMLGEVQSGHAAEVGYELYLQMLEEAVAELKGEAAAEGPEPEMHLALKAGLPEDYVPDPQVRLGLYRRLGAARGRDQLDAIRGELDDRFGPPPEAAANLLMAVELKALLRQLWATRLDLSPAALQVHFTSSARLEVDRLLDMASREPRRVQVHPDGRVNVVLNPRLPLWDQAKDFLHSIGARGN
ncbi:MAG: transcription-repair coupling factor [Pseudomonadota bacterium]